MISTPGGNIESATTSFSASFGFHDLHNLVDGSPTGGVTAGFDSRQCFLPNGMMDVHGFFSCFT
jgi:hypothetical protein